MFYSNQLNGEIPPSICNLRYLHVLYLSNNNLEGKIPECLGNLSRSLVILYLHANNLNGCISTMFVEGCSLLSLNLNGNALGGPLPQSLSNCRSLRVIDIGNNEIQDKFPFWMGALPDLQILVMRSNKFNGTISAASMTKLRFPKLQVFDISHNEFVGSLPDKYLNNFRAMINAKDNKTEESSWLSTRGVRSTFTLKGLDMFLGRILTTFTMIDLSSNRFSGSIPFSIGRLNSLVYLNLSRNSLTGHIPVSIGNMSALESLDLSSNKLVGEIPEQLKMLTFLAKLNLSMNNLSGQIPQSPQLSTFENDSYVGNPALCGFPLTKKCQGLGMVPENEDDEDPDFFDGFTWKVVLLGYGCGFIIGVTLGYYIFQWGRPKWLVELCF